MRATVSADPRRHNRANTLSGLAIASFADMRLKARILGHQLHPILVVFPIALFVMTAIFDGVHLGTGNPMWARLAFWNMTAGIIGGLLAAIPGFIDWLFIPRRTRAKTVGALHMVVNVAAVALFIANWAIRYEGSIDAVGPGTFILSIVGVVVLGVGGWFGGELVERLGIGVWEDANADAISSLEEKRRARHAGFRPTEPRPV